MQSSLKAAWHRTAGRCNLKIESSQRRKARVLLASKTWTTQHGESCTGFNIFGTCSDNAVWKVLCVSQKGWCSRCAPAVHVKATTRLGILPLLLGIEWVKSPTGGSSHKENEAFRPLGRVVRPHAWRSPKAGPLESPRPGFRSTEEEQHQKGHEQRTRKPQKTPERTSKALLCSLVPGRHVDDPKIVTVTD